MISTCRPVTHALFSPVQVGWQHSSAVYCVIRFPPEAAKIFIWNPISLSDRHTWSIWIFDHNYRMGGLIEKWFHRCHPDTCRHFPLIFSKIRKINKQPIVINALMGPLIISKLNCTWLIRNQPQTYQTTPDTRYHHWQFNRDSQKLSLPLKPAKSTVGVISLKIVCPSKT